ncbi:MAG: hypothetical protein ACHQJX_10080, partial [Candidatus Acidiferrales bacterium]
LEEALIRASNPDEFKLRIQGIRSSADAAREEMERTMTEFERTGPRRLNDGDSCACSKSNARSDAGTALRPFSAVHVCKCVSAIPFVVAVEPTEISCPGKKHKSLDQ